MEGLTTYQGGNLTRQELNDELFQKFIVYTDREPTTVKGYVTCLRQFLKWLHDEGITHPSGMISWPIRSISTGKPLEGLARSPSRPGRNSNTSGP